MSGAEFKPLSPGDPVVGVVRGEETGSLAVFHILATTAGTESAAGSSRLAVASAEQKAEKPARYGAEGDVS